ncbi:hypothetical protein BRD14_05780 [Halobacteriales archaeon SW_5_68_122]|nr:MAG: hypothetical protein BRD14_05780 [Halobacteriales archaeon SW_5_68_122]
MARSRMLTALAGLLVSLAVSAAIYVATGSLLLFLVVPFVPFLFSRSLGGDGDERETPPVRECPECDFRARDPEFDYCPRDGRRLRETDRRY